MVIEMPLDILEIWKKIPHRFPFLLVDRVTKLEELGIEGYKNVTVNEPFFCGHFPTEPIMPGVLICEAAAQLAAIFLKCHDGYENKLILFAGIDGVRFKRPVLPGDKLDMRIDVIKIKGPVGKAKFESRVDGEIAAYGEMIFSAVDR